MLKHKLKLNNSKKIRFIIEKYLKNKSKHYKVK